MTRSGFRKSSRAAPSLRNSGLETTENEWEVAAPMAVRSLAFVPTGTVDLTTTTFGASMARAMSSATRRTWVMSAEPSSSCGVPTAMNRRSLARTAAASSVVKRSRSSAALRTISSSSPGS